MDVKNVIDDNRNNNTLSNVVMTEHGCRRDFYDYKESYYFLVLVLVHLKDKNIISILINPKLQYKLIKS